MFFQYTDMFLSPEQFLEKYRNEGLPYFKIFKGSSTAEKSVISRFMENPEGMEGYDLINHGSEMLKDFFEMYPDGNVNIMTKNNPSTVDKNANFTDVRWGNAAIAGGRQVKQHTSRYDQHPATMFGGFDRMMGFLSKMYENQNAAQMAAIEARTEARIREMELRQEHKEQMEKLMAEYGQPEPSLGETLQHELVGLIRPAAEFFMSQGAHPMPMPPGVAGMEDTKGTTPETPPDNGVRPGKSPMHGASFDLILVEIRKIAETVFPEYPINEVMPALRAKCIEQKALIRGQVIPIIEQRRKAANQEEK